MRNAGYCQARTARPATPDRTSFRRGDPARGDPAGSPASRGNATSYARYHVPEYGKKREYKGLTRARMD